LVRVNDLMSMVLWTCNFLHEQGQTVTDNIIYQDNQSAILLANNGKSSSGKRTRHLDIQHFFITDPVGRKEVRIEYCPTAEMLADFFMKPLQCSLFQWMQAQIMNIPYDIPLPVTSQSPDIPQEYVGGTSWAGVVKPSMACLVIQAINQSSSGLGNRSDNASDTCQQRSFSSARKFSLLTELHRPVSRYCHSFQQIYFIRKLRLHHCS